MQQTLDKKMHLEANFINHVKIAKQSHWARARDCTTQLALAYGDGKGTSGSSWNYAYNMYTSDPQAFLGISPTELYLYVY